MTLVVVLKLLQVGEYLLTKCYIKKKHLLVMNHSRDLFLSQFLAVLLLMSQLIDCTVQFYLNLEPSLSV